VGAFERLRHTCSCGAGLKREERDMQKRVAKMTLCRETLRSLTGPELTAAAAGRTNLLSVCIQTCASYCNPCGTTTTTAG
jgi:hypothetical protein